MRGIFSFIRNFWTLYIRKFSISCIVIIYDDNEIYKSDFWIDHTHHGEYQQKGKSRPWTWLLLQWNRGRWSTIRCHRQSLPRNGESNNLNRFDKNHFNNLVINDQTRRYFVEYRSEYSMKLFLFFKLFKICCTLTFFPLLRL